MFITSDPLGHAGLTVAAAFALEYMRGRNLKFLVRRKRQLGEGESRVDRMRIWNIDYRLVILGSLLPDLLDRPLGHWLLPEIFNPSGRLFGHTLLFLTLLVTFSLIMLRFTRSRTPLVFALASAGHLLIDRMWESPRTLLWPLYGIRFGGAEFDLSPHWLQWVQNGSGQIIIDSLATLVLVLFVARLVRRRAVLKWLRTGGVG